MIDKDVFTRTLSMKPGTTKIYRTTDYARGVKIHVPEHGMTVRVRLRDPKDFIPASFRLHDIGRPGKTRRIAGRLKSTGRWATQSFLFDREDLETSPATQALFKKIVLGR